MVSPSILSTAAALLATLPLHVQAGLYTKNSPVLQIDGKNYDRLIAQSNYTSIVEFYAPWCGHCKNLQPAYEKAAKALSGLAKVAAVDCDEESNKSFCGSMGVQGFPTLKIVKPGKKPGRPIVEDYQGARSAKAIVEAVTDKMPNLVKRVQDKDLETFLAGSGPKAVLFSEKGKSGALLKAVAVEFKDSIQVAQIRSSEKASLELFGVSKFPTLILLPGGWGTEKIVFEDQMDKEAMVKFLSQAAAPNPDPPLPRVKLQKLGKKGEKVKKKASQQEAFEKASASHASEEKPVTATDETLEEEVTESPSPEVDTQKPVVLPDPAPAIPVLATEAELKEACLGSKTGTCILSLPPAEPDAHSGAAGDALAEIAQKYKTHGRQIFPFYVLPQSNEGAAQLTKALALETSTQIIAINGRRGWWRHVAQEEYYVQDNQDKTQERLENWIDAIRLDDGTKNKLPAGLIPEEEQEEEGDEEAAAAPVDHEAPEPETPEEPSVLDTSDEAEETASIKHGEL